jgi:guanylate kinase
MAEYPGKYAFSVSHTTRLPRPGETDGVQYNFVTQDRFKVRMARDASAVR